MSLPTPPAKRTLEINGQGSSATTATYGGSSAFATGIFAYAGANSMTISNSGVINVAAEVADGGVVTRWASSRSPTAQPTTLPEAS